MERADCSQSMDVQTASPGQGTSVESVRPSLHFISILNLNGVKTDVKGKVKSGDQVKQTLG